MHSYYRYIFLILSTIFLMGCIDEQNNTITPNESGSNCEPIDSIILDNYTLSAAQRSKLVGIQVSFTETGSALLVKSEFDLYKKEETGRVFYPYRKAFRSFDAYWVSDSIIVCSKPKPNKNNRILYSVDFQDTLTSYKCFDSSDEIKESRQGGPQFDNIIESAPIKFIRGKGIDITGYGRDFHGKLKVYFY